MGAYFAQLTDTTEVVIQAEKTCWYDFPLPSRVKRVGVFASHSMLVQNDTFAFSGVFLAHVEQLECNAPIQDGSLDCAKALRVVCCSSPTEALREFCKARNVELREFCG